MGGPKPRARLIPAQAKVAGVLGLGWALVFFGVEAAFLQLARLAWALRTTWLHWSTAETFALQDALWNGEQILRQYALFPIVFAAMLAVPLGMLVRTVARARARAGFPDPLDRVREWTSAHPTATGGLLAAPALVALFRMGARVVPYIQSWVVRTYGPGELEAALHGHEHAIYTVASIGVLGLSAVGMAGVYLATRGGLRTLLAPTFDPEPKAKAPAEDRIHFDAVAVSAETRAAVGAMAALPLVTLLGIRAAHLGDAGTQAALAVYVALAVGGALAFRRASRVAVGVDGVFVTGSSRARFFAYKDLDAVRANHGTIELCAGGRVKLCLQLHGEDATLEKSIVARVEEAIAKARAGESAGAGLVVASASPAELARLAEGAADYRAPALTRDQLWALVEGPEHDAHTRTQAARALARACDDGARARLRVAADHCAEPKVRVLLRELAEEDEEESSERTRRRADPFAV